MKALTTTAFILMAMLSAFTVYFALQSDSLDGEPYASIALKPPVKTIAKVQPTPAPEPATAQQQSAAADTVAEVIETAKADENALPVPQPVQPAAAVKAASKKTEPPVPGSATEKVATTAADTLILPAETGLGLGVGNLGPIPEAPAASN